MYTDTSLTTHLQESNAIETKSKVLAEWNLNIFENIDVVGNYKNRPTNGSPANTLPDTYTFEDKDTNFPTWYGFTDSDTTIDGGYTNESATPVTFTNPDIRQKSLMSLEDCFKKFRPRSGINKLRYYENIKRSAIPVSGKDVFNKPRYYPAGQNDNFKYWSSYRRSGNDQYGISDTGDPFYIQDTAPFIKYKNKVPTNKIVIKIQTNVSKTDNGSLINSVSPANKDPFFIGSSPNYKSTPLSWKIQKLDAGRVWKDIQVITTDQFTTDAGWDGYFQLSYGLINQILISSNPAIGIYKNNFKLIGTLLSSSALPNIQGDSFKGQSYLVKSSSTDKGKIYIYNGGISSTVINNYTEIVPVYGWYRSEEDVTNSQLFVTELDATLAPSYVEDTNTIYREFEYIRGLRIVVNTMVNRSTTFDLIELSPRLSVDLTDMTSSFSLKKYASDLGVSSLPVGQLLASNGTMSIFDHNQVFNLNNKNSLLNVYESDTLKFSFISKNLQLKFYETISKVKQLDNTYKDYYIPLKTMYADGFPQYDDSNRNITMNLRDLVFYFESQIAPEILLTNASTSYIVATLLDSIGFSNYSFTRLSNEKDTVIPYFMISPNKTIMQVLQDLAIATQTTMFFDESNNFIVMGKKYLVPDNAEDRSVNITLYGSDTDSKKTNILNISSESNDIYNDGKITYYNRFIKRQSNKISTYSLIDKYQDVSYQKIVFWSIGDTITKKTQSKNDEDPNATSYTLSAIPLATTLSDVEPRVDSSHNIVDNAIDFGDGVWWIQRNQGYFYANGEIIKYDAVEYQVDDEKIWITSNDEYNKYYLQLLNGQKMYKTGRVRIYAEPYYENGLLKIGAVAKNGRAQFGTTRTTHSAGKTGLDSSWTTAKTPLVTDWQYLFKKTPKTSITTNIENQKTNLQKAKMSEPTTTIKNFLSIPRYNTKTKSMVYSESVQASALCLNGPSFEEPTNNGPSLNYVKKDLGTKISYDTFGTRLRILGSKGKNKSFQKPTSSYEAYSTKGVNTSLAPSTINGASGGIAIMTNSAGEGYYYEIVALDYVNTEAVVATDGASFNTLIFYKLKTVNGILVPTVLFSTFENIFVDTGKFTSKVLSALDGDDSVYDLGIKLDKVSDKSWAFSIYLDNVLLGTATDIQPLSTNTAQNISLFTRGSSQMMFENVYALKTMTQKPSTVSASTNIFNASINENVSYSKYALGPLIKTGFLSKLSPSAVPENEIYYEEFGTVMRECAYFNVKFDKSYPALRSIISPIPASLGGYVVTGYTSTPYRAEFLVFNTTDFALSLGDGKDYSTILNIVGIGFTDETAKELTVDGFYNNRSNFSTNTDYSVETYKNKYIDIKNNRVTYGNKSFNIDSPYIQNEDTATELMEYIISRVSKPRKAVGVQVFGMPIIQLGDLVNFSYKTQKLLPNGTAITESLPNSITGNNFVVYAIEHSTQETGPSTILYLSEVV